AHNGAMERLRLLLATQRAGVDFYFRNLPTAGEAELTVQQLPLDAAAISRCAELDHATLAVVDVDGDHDAALRGAAQLRSRRGELPVIALFCCSRGVTPARLRELSA